MFGVFQAEIGRQRWRVVSEGHGIDRWPSIFGGEPTRRTRGDGHQKSRTIRQRVRKRVCRGNDDRLLETRRQQVDPVERQGRQTGESRHISMVCNR